MKGRGHHGVGGGLTQPRQLRCRAITGPKAQSEARTLPEVLHEPGAAARGETLSTNRKENPAEFKGEAVASTDTASGEAASADRRSRCPQAVEPARHRKADARREGRPAEASLRGQPGTRDRGRRRGNANPAASSPIYQMGRNSTAPRGCWPEEPAAASRSGGHSRRPPAAASPPRDELEAPETPGAGAGRPSV